MRNLLLTISFDGTAYHGWQVQENAVTVQQTLQDALEHICSKRDNIVGCSRTDAGVHANEFCLTVEAAGATVPPDKLPVAVARFLPNDLSLFYAKKCDDTFHPRYDVKGKEYLYRIINSRIYEPFEYGRAWFLARPITDSGLSRMRDAAEYFLGKHDFSSFMTEGSDVEDTVRTIKYLSIEKSDERIDIKICADGFLYNMVRIIVGTLTEVAFGRFEPSEISNILFSHDRTRAGMTAPPEGLYLNKVFY